MLHFYHLYTSLCVAGLPGKSMQAGGSGELPLRGAAGIIMVLLHFCIPPAAWGCCREACISGELPLRGAAGIGKDKHCGAALLYIYLPPLCADADGGEGKHSFMIGGAPAAQAGCRGAGRAMMTKKGHSSVELENDAYIMIGIIIHHIMDIYTLDTIYSLYSLCTRRQPRRSTSREASGLCYIISLLREAATVAA